MQRPRVAPHVQVVDAKTIAKRLAAALPDHALEIIALVRTEVARSEERDYESVQPVAGDRMQSFRRQGASTKSRKTAKRQKPAGQENPSKLDILTAAVEQINEVAGDHTFGRAYRALAAKFERWPPERRRFIDAVLATPAAERSLGDEAGATLLETTTVLLIVEDIATLGVADNWARDCLEAFRDLTVAGAYPPGLRLYPIARYPARHPRVGRLCELLLAIPDGVLARMAKCPRCYADRPCGRYFVDNSPTADHHERRTCSLACKKAVSLAGGNSIFAKRKTRAVNPLI
jgi:hypothetical protein